MFPPTKNPLPFSTETLLKWPFPWDHQNPSYAQEEPPFFLQFPSPFLDDQDMPLNQIFSHHPGPPTHAAGESAPVNNSSPTTKGAKEAKKKTLQGSTPRRRTGKKDRHSKICTAQGVRDRRMRLSLQIARKFFDLQDMLGFDKASSTIEWLLSQSKPAIKELTAAASKHTNNGSSSESFMSECEAMSTMDEDDDEENSNTAEAAENRKVFKKKKESREKARARARERTKEKMMTKTQNLINPFLDQESSIANSYAQEQHSSSHEGIETHFASSVGITEKYIFHQYHDVDQNIINNAAPISSGTIDPTSNTFMEFLGNWELAPFSGNPSGSAYLGATNLDFQPVVQENNFSCNQY